MKRYIAVARVSSREQEREGFSLDVQIEGFKVYVIKHGGILVRIFRIAETASKSEERKVFKEAIEYAKRHHRRIDGILFYKVDRAARNLCDLVLLEELESQYGIEFISITQPTENTPTGRMVRRQLATMAAFYTEQQSLDVREGIAKRVQSGLPPSRASYGYRNVRRHGRSIVEIHPENGPKVQRIFELFAYHGLSVQRIIEQVFDEGLVCTLSKPKFSERKIYGMFHDRNYIGEVTLHGEWFPGEHEPLIDKDTWDRVQVLLGERVYRSHQMLYAGGLVNCGHCGRPITGEVKEKHTRKGTRQYTYYRCARYTAKGHPRVRLREEEFEKQVIALFEKMDAHSEPIKSWLITAFLERTKDARRAAAHRIKELKRQLSRVVKQQDELLELRLSSKINDNRFEAKQAELRQRQENLRQQVQSCTSTHQQNDEVAAKAADVFRMILDQWPTGQFTIKRRILEIVFVKLTLVEKRLIPSKRTPFELLAAG